MNTIRPCGCKGQRSCLKCERQFGISKSSLTKTLQTLYPLAFCVQCQRFYTGWKPSDIQRQHPHHNNEDGLLIPGVFVQNNFLTPQERENIMQHLDKLPWCISQSGRRKQNFGPKTNFKKLKLQNGQFSGFPRFTEFIQKRFKHMDILNNFQTIEQCTLEYNPDNGASIDPHIDDCWIWGERVVTVNCMGNAVLTLALYEESENVENFRNAKKKYNLHLVPTYENDLLEPLLTSEKLNFFKGKVIRIPMANSSLIVLYGPARYQFEHCVLREDIVERRVCLAYREFTKPYLSGGELNEQGRSILDNASKFWNENQMYINNNENIISNNQISNNNGGHYEGVR